MKLDKNKLWYLASPYSSSDEFIRNSRFKSICLIANKLIEDGYKIFCPIAMSHPIEAYKVSESRHNEIKTVRTDFSYWKELDLLLLSKCDGIIVCMLPGWEQSIGVQAEMEFARENNITVHFIGGDLAKEYFLDEFADYIRDVLEMGALKHGDNNWKEPNGKKSSRDEMCDSLFHHLSQTYAGNLIDAESGFDHRQHGACRNVMSLYIDKHNLRGN